MKINPEKRIGIILLFLCLGLIVACQKKAPVSPKDKVIARVDGVPIVQRDLVRYYRSMVQTDPSEKDVTLPMGLKKALLEKLIEEKLLLQMAAKEGLKIDPDELDHLYEGTARDYGPALTDYLKKLGMTPNDWKGKLRQDLLIEKVIRYHLRKVASPTYGEIRTYYETHQKDFQIPMQYRFSQIVVPTLKAAEQVMQKLKAGGDFARLAKQYSISPEGKQGGDLGYWREDHLPEEFLSVRQMKIGEYSGIIHSPYGYHILLLTGVRDARDLTLKEAGPTIARRLEQEKRDAEKARWLKALKKKANIVIYEKVLKETTFH